MITKISTAQMSRDEWLGERRKGIGGSDAGTILGFNKYSSPYALWAEKTGAVIPEDISDKEAVRLGNDLEQYVADRFCEATGKRVQRDNHIIRNSDYPFAHANIDRKVIGENAGLECKTTSNYEYIKLLEAGRFPEVWLCQMTHYMAVTEADHWYLAVLAFGRGFYWYEIKREEAEIKALMAVEHEFWDMVLNNTPPSTDGSDSCGETIKKLYPESDGTSIDLSAFEVNCELYENTCSKIKELQQIADAQANFIKEYMGRSEVGFTGKYKISWKSQSRKTFDKKAYEHDFGTLPEQYYKVSNTRVFKITEVN